MPANMENSAVATGLEKVSFHLNTKKGNAKECSKFSKPGFSNMWTVNFQMFKLVLEQAEEPETKLPTSTGSSKKQESSRKHLFLLYEYTKGLDCVDHIKLWKILKEMGIPDHLTCLLRNLYAVQEGTVRTGHGITDWFQIRKGVCQGWKVSPCLFNLHTEYIMRNVGLDERQARIKMLGEISITSDTLPWWLRY